jgi:hypothetical protein
LRIFGHVEETKGFTEPPPEVAPTLTFKLSITEITCSKCIPAYDLYGVLKP